MSIWRSRWAAIGAATAVTLGGGGLFRVGAASPESTFVAIEPVRVLDTRFDIGLTDAFQHRVGRDLDVTGTIAIVGPGNTASAGTVVPDGATAIVANVTAVNPTTAGFVAVRPGSATGAPTTSNVNFTSGGVVVPNSVSVELPTSGAKAGTVNLFFSGTGAGATTHLLLDIVGYYVQGTGAPGPKGDTGDPGDTGPRGFSAWDVIPSGTTITGVASNRLGAHDASSFFSTRVDLPGIAPVPLSFGTVNMAADASAATVDDDATCTGTVDAPTAPPGKVCIYTYGLLNAELVQGSSALHESDRAFFVEWGAVAAGQTHVWTTWAYTAP